MSHLLFHSRFEPDVDGVVFSVGVFLFCFFVLCYLICFTLLLLLWIHQEVRFNKI